MLDTLRRTWRNMGSRDVCPEDDSLREWLAQQEQREARELEEMFAEDAAREAETRQENDRVYEAWHERAHANGGTCPNGACGDADCIAQAYEDIAERRTERTMSRGLEL
jgi:hypothetical protein